MILSLFKKLDGQLRRQEQPEAFMTAWQLLHRLLRSYFVNKLGDEKLVAMLWARSIAKKYKKNDDEAYIQRWTNHLVSVRNETRNRFIENEADRVNRAREDELFDKLSMQYAGLCLRERIQERQPELWDDYTDAARQLRHFIAHGKIFRKAKHKQKSQSQLADSLVAIISEVDSIFGTDHFYTHIRHGAPLPPFVQYKYDSTTRRVTISEHPELASPEDNE